jgi:hypothetical protein
VAKDDASLKRLGGGRWETRDGRFAIEPQSGTWVIVDSESTDELGLPLVRGPFPSLTAAKEAIAAIRTAAPVTSPLADRLKEGVAASEATESEAAGRRRTTKRSKPPEPPPPPPPPPEPRWLSELRGADRRRALDLIERLEKAGFDDPEDAARDELVRGRPAVAREAIVRAVARVLATHDVPDDAAQAIVDALVDGSDRDLGVRWRLVDGDDRTIGDIEVGRAPHDHSG